MIKHPFTNGIKPYISGTDATLNIVNFADSAILAANDICQIIGDATYNAIVDKITTPALTNTDKWNEVLERLRFALAPLTLYHHFIFLQIRVSNNGITTYKSTDETTAYKYQTDEAKESLLTRHGAFLKELLDYLELENELFTTWKDSTQRTAINTSLIKSYREFDTFYNTQGDAAFFVRSATLRNEIQAEELKSFIGTFEGLDEAIKTKLKRALAYLTLYRALTEWDYYMLPSPLKRTINNELSLKNGREIDTIKNNIAGKYKNLAESILTGIATQKEADKQATEAPTLDVKVNSYLATDSDKHIFM